MRLLPRMYNPNTGRLSWSTRLAAVAAIGATVFGFSKIEAPWMLKGGNTPVIGPDNYLPPTPDGSRPYGTTGPTPPPVKSPAALPPVGGHVNLDPNECRTWVTEHPLHYEVVTGAGAAIFKLVIDGRTHDTCGTHTGVTAYTGASEQSSPAKLPLSSVANGSTIIDGTVVRVVEVQAGQAVCESTKYLGSPSSTEWLGIDGIPGAEHTEFFVPAESVGLPAPELLERAAQSSTSTQYFNTFEQGC